MCFLIMLFIDTWVISVFLTMYSVLWVILLPNWNCFSQFCSSQQEHLLFHIPANTCSEGWMRLSHLLLAPFIPRIHNRAGDSLLDKRHSLCGKASTVLRYCISSQNSIIRDSNHVKHGSQEPKKEKTYWRAGKETDVNTAPLFLIIAMMCGVWDLHFPTRDQTHSPCIGSEES